MGAPETFIVAKKNTGISPGRLKINTAAFVLHPGRISVNMPIPK